jgi:hypothetical protein
MMTSSTLLGLVLLQGPVADDPPPSDPSTAQTSIVPAPRAHAASGGGLPAPEVVARSIPPHLAPAPAKIPPRGVPMFITGSILMGVGVTLVGLAVVSFAEGCRPDEHGGCWWGKAGGKLLMAQGVPALGVGLPLFAAGAHRYRVWKAWERRQTLRVRPRISHIRGAVTVGLELNF